MSLSEQHVIGTRIKILPKLSISSMNCAFGAQQACVIVQNAQTKETTQHQSQVSSENRVVTPL